MIIREQIRKLAKAIKPVDSLEESHIVDTLEWIDSGVEIFRVKKPATPNKHLVCYFCLYDANNKKVLLVEHRKAQLWLPAGGHVEPGEHPKSTVSRECMEELRTEAKLLLDNPIFLTSTETVGLTAGHTDVSFWYLLEGDSSKSLVYDSEEFLSIKWFHLNDIPYEKSDPHMKRFINKLAGVMNEK